MTDESDFIYDKFGDLIPNLPDSFASFPCPALPSDAHAKFLLYHIVRQLPIDYLSLDPQRIVVLHFAIIGLDLLGKLEMLPSSTRAQIIEWIYSLQLPDFGWTGSPLLLSSPAQTSPSHFAATYSAICLLKTLGDDLSRVYKQGIVNLISSSVVHNITSSSSDHLAHTTQSDAAAQQPLATTDLLLVASHNPDLIACAISPPSSSHQPALPSNHCTDTGVFFASTTRDEADVRLVFCALALCKLLNLWEEPNLDINFTAIFNFLASCQTFDGSFGLTNGFREGHGGATHTAVVSYYILLERFCALSPQQRAKWVITPFDLPRLSKWLVSIQGDGFRGRTCKSRDCCYTFWCGALFSVLNEHSTQWIHPRNNAYFVTFCENRQRGGFGKDEVSESEILHTFYAIAGLSLMDCYDRAQQQQHQTQAPPETISSSLCWNDVDPILGLSMRASQQAGSYRSFNELFASLGINFD